MGEKIRILIADEEEGSRQILSRILEEEGYDVTTAASSEEALETFRKEPYPLLVTDVRTWERSGIETLLEMKRQHPETEIIISSSDDSMGTALLAIRAGVHDYLMKPFGERDLVTSAVRRVAEKIHIRREKKFLVETLERRNRELDQMNNILTQLATHDGLTGLYNHRHFQETLANEVDRSRRAGKVFSLLLVDIDNFKQYNDSHGHSHGDDVLRRLGELLKKRLRKSDLPARYGGEEFIVLLPETNKERAQRVAEEIRKKVENHPFPGRETQPSGKLTVSISVVSYPEDGTEPSLLTYSADRALSRAKGKGRNVVC
jgi:diguanylate cyclase (GGDEF)-like protein